jgi:hypothetical protein
MSGWQVRFLCVSEVSLIPVLIAGTLYTFDRDMKKLLNTA